MPEVNAFMPLSLSDLFALESIAVYEIDKDVVLTGRTGNTERLLHLFENEIRDNKYYGINLGKNIEQLGRPSVIGKIALVEVRYAHDEKNWDCGSLKLLALDGSTVTIDRHDESFPEPTFRIRK